jgi:D-alanyl-D-alanine carboxypeptidase
MTIRKQPVSQPTSSWKHRGLFLFALAGVLLFAVLAPRFAESGPDVPSPQPPEPSPDAFQAALDSMQVRFGFPGATAAYVRTDGTAGEAATGFADVEVGQPMTPASRMLAASIGKTFVGATAAALNDEGVLDLDAPIARWLGDRPWFGDWPNREQITLRHLLTHRSGLADHVHLDAFAEAVSQRWQERGNPFPPDTLIQLVVDRPALFAPGEGWAYSDTGYLLAGLIIEAATGRDYYDLVQERFLTPLGLRHTSPSNRRDLPGLAAGYVAESPLGVPRKTLAADGTMLWHPGMEWTGGGLVSTSGDLAQWGAALFGGPALPAAARDQVLRAVPVDPTQPDVRYGLGVAVYAAGPFGPVYGHGGWIPGYVSSLRYYADHGVAIAFQINTDDGLEVDSTSVVQAVEARLANVVLPFGSRSTAERKDKGSR